MPVSAETKTDSSDKRLSFTAATEALQVHTPPLAITNPHIRDLRETIADTESGVAKWT